MEVNIFNIMSSHPYSSSFFTCTPRGQAPSLPRINGTGLRLIIIYVVVSAFADCIVVIGLNSNDT